MALNQYSRAVSERMLECALYLSCCGAQDPTTHYTPVLVDAVKREWPKGLALSEFLRLTAYANANEDVSRRSTHRLLECAFQTHHWMVASSPSTYNVSGILSNIANKKIIDGFTAVDQSWKQIAAVTSVNDLKEHVTYALTGSLEYERVGLQGELKHGQLAEESYTIQAKTYGKLFGISEDDIINDSLRAFDQVQRLLGRGSALALNKVVWGTLLSSILTFWTGARKNRLTGAASALSIDSLTNASTLLETQVDPDGNPMGTTGAILAVPAELKTIAHTLVSEAEIRKDGTAIPGSTYSVRNPHAGKYTVASSPYLNNAMIPGGSATHWLLLADPRDLVTIEVAFLHNQQLPTIESASASIDTLGVVMRGVHRFGASLNEYRASVYSTGV